ncbi:MAG: hypothetical protein ACYDAY_11065 [Candidatus Dormibacteria bacterium]
MAILLGLGDHQIAAWQHSTVRSVVFQGVADGGDLLTDPNINARIPNGHAQITGGGMDLKRACQLIQR